MASTTFVDRTTPIQASWLNDVNTFVYNNVVSVKKYGVVGDGVTDDSTAFAAALSAITTGTLLQLNGLTIKINQQNIVSAKSNFMIDGQGGTIIAANGMTVAANKELLSFRNCADFTIKNITIDGNRANRTPVEVAAHNVEFRTCVRFVSERVRSINAVVDGFIFNTSTATDNTTFCRDFLMLDCTANNCYRQGMSIINGYNGIILGGAYTNTTGTAPQAGIDIESNSGAATPGNAWILVKGVRFSGNAGRGILVSGVSSGAEIWITENEFDANTLGGVDANGNAVYVERNIFRNHGTGVVNGIVTFSASVTPQKAGTCIGNTFTTNTSTVYCIHAHSSTSNIRVERNNILDHVSGGGININGQDPQIRGNYINTTGGIGILLAATDPLIIENVITNALGRAIYSTGSVRPKIIGNTCRDVTSVTGAYIQVDDASSFVDDNNCISATSATTTFGIRITNVASRSVSGNTFINLHSTDPITITGAGSVVKRQHNSGGTSNTGDMNWSKFFKTDALTVATLPAALTYTLCRSIVTDSNSTTFGAVVAGGGANIVPVYSDGTNWRIG